MLRNKDPNLLRRNPQRTLPHLISKHPRSIKRPINQLLRHFPQNLLVFLHIVVVELILRSFKDTSSDHGGEGFLVGDEFVFGGVFGFLF